MDLLAIRTTYLELFPEMFGPAFLQGTASSARRVPPTEAAFARRLYRIVGWAYQGDSKEDPPFPPRRIDYDQNNRDNPR